MGNTNTQFSSYDSVVNFLENSSMVTIDLSLDRIKVFLDKIGNPQKSLSYIHIAGTNGKGSVLKYLETILVEAGYIVGSFTSPHLIDYTERFTINGTAISQTDFLIYANELFSRLNDHQEIKLTLFEFLTVLAFCYFRDKQVDIVLLEVGLGGRLDATNVIDQPLMSIITSIDFDHTNYLGDTLDKIAFEKAGIIKNNTYVVVNKDNKGLKSFLNVAQGKNTQAVLVDSSNYRFIADIVGLKQHVLDLSGNTVCTFTMPGKHQFENVLLALKAIDVLNLSGFNISDSSIKKGIAKTKWPGRAQYFTEKKVLIDGAHNPAGAKALRELIDAYFNGTELIWIIGTLNTKDSCGILQELIRDTDMVIFTEPKVINPTPLEDLKGSIINMGLNNKISLVENLLEACSLAKSIQNDNQMIIITGSLYLVGEYLKLISPASTDKCPYLK